jgi:hypothetical protein
MPFWFYFLVNGTTQKIRAVAVVARIIILFNPNNIQKRTAITTRITRYTITSTKTIKV